MTTSWRVLTDGPESAVKVVLKACRSGWTPSPGRTGPDRTELQLATAEYNTGSYVEFTPGQARAVASALLGLAGSAARAGAGWTHALPAGRACCGGAAPRFR